MNHLNMKSLTTMETSIYDHIKKETKVLYDKEQLQNVCQIKSKIWVTRSVNTLIDLGLIKEIKDLHSIESFLTLNTSQTTPSESPILLQDNNKIELNTEEQKVLKFLYEQSNSGQRAIQFVTEEIAQQSNLSKSTVRQRIRLLKQMKLIKGVNNNSLVALTTLGRKYFNPHLQSTPKKQTSNQLHLNNLPTNISKTERKILAALSLLKEDYPFVDLNHLRNIFGLKKEIFNHHLMNLSKEKYLSYSYQTGIITLTLDVLPKTGSYQTTGQEIMNQYKNTYPQLNLTEEEQPKRLSDNQCLFLNYYMKLSLIEQRMVNFLIQLHLKDESHWIETENIRILLSINKNDISNYLNKLKDKISLEFNESKSYFRATIDQTTLKSFYDLVPPLEFKETLFQQALQTAITDDAFENIYEHTNLSADQTAICLIPDSTYEKRVFLIDTENIGLPFCEQLTSVLTPNDTIILMLSQNSEKQLIPSNIIHLVLNAPWKTKSFQVPIFQTKQNALDHALISELTIQLLTHQNDQFFIVSRDKGFLSAIHHLKERLNLREDQLQLIPTFFLK